MFPTEYNSEQVFPNHRLYKQQQIFAYDSVGWLQLMTQISYPSPTDEPTQVTS